MPKGWFCTGKELLKGELGSGRCPLRPPKFRVVGVFGADRVESSAGGRGAGRLGLDMGARGVVGVVASVE